MAQARKSLANFDSKYKAIQIQCVIKNLYTKPKTFPNFQRIKRLIWVHKLYLFENYFELKRISIARVSEAKSQKITKTASKLV